MSLCDLPNILEGQYFYKTRVHLDLGVHQERPVWVINHMMFPSINDFKMTRARRDTEQNISIRDFWAAYVSFSQRCNWSCAYGALGAQNTSTSPVIAECCME